MTEPSATGSSLVHFLRLSGMVCQPLEKSRCAVVGRLPWALAFVLAICLASLHPALAETQPTIVNGAGALRNPVTGEIIALDKEGGTAVQLAPGDILQVLSFVTDYEFKYKEDSCYGGRPVHYAYPSLAQEIYYPYFVVPKDLPPLLEFSDSEGKYYCNGKLFGIRLKGADATAQLKQLPEEDLASLTYVQAGYVPPEVFELLSESAGRPMVILLESPPPECFPLLNKLELAGLIIQAYVLREQFTVSGLPHLRFLTLFDATALKEITLDKSLSALQSLTLWRSPELASVKGMADLPNLKYLTITGSKSLTGESFSTAGPLEGICLRDCPSLSSLKQLKLGPETQHADFRGCTGLTDVSSLSVCASIRRIFLSGSPLLTDVTVLAGMKHLEILEISECPALAELPDLGGSTALSSLAVRGTAIKDLSFLGKCAAVVNLDVSDSPNLASIEGVRSLGRLEVIRLTRCPKIRSIESLAGKQALRALLACKCGVTTLEGLSGLTAILLLRMMDCPDLKDISAIEGLVSLESLALSGCPNIASLAPLYSLSSLRRLDVSGATDEDFSKLSCLAKLMSLTVTSCQGMKDLAFCSGLVLLQQLDIQDCPDLAELSGVEKATSLAFITVRNAPLLRSLEPLAGLPHLVLLVLAKVPNVTKDEIEDLKKALPACRVSRLE
ncbi:MAG: hypothetical protein WC712_07515 [Candidatus Brocadiia bacterium]